MNDNTYSGWTNYETWNFNLWYDDAFHDDAEYCFNDAEADDTFTKAENATFALANIIEEFCDDMLAEHGNDSASFFTDVLNTAISSVNWHEIARHYIDDVDDA